jgi:long-chain acyl-CoA synthetase
VKVGRVSIPDFPELTLPQMLREHARRMPHCVAVRQKDFGIWKPCDWETYAARAAHVGYGLRALGVPEGGHVAVLSENRVEWVLTQLGAGMIGAITVGVYPTSPANEVAYVLAHAEAKVVVCQDQEQVDKVLDRLDELPRLRQIVVMETKGLRQYPAERVRSFAAIEQRGRADASANPRLIDDILARQRLADIGLMVYTSGSTGRPKGAMLSYRNLRAEAIAVSERLSLAADDTHLSYLPLCHVAEQMVTVMAPIYLGSTVNFGESIRTVQEDLREVAPTTFLGVPRIWEKLHAAISIKLTEAGGPRRWLFERAYAACEPFAEKPPAVRTLRQRAIFAFWYLVMFRALQNYVGLRRAGVAMTGAAPISPRIVRFFRAIGIPLIEVYGLTETSGMCSGQRIGEALRPGSVGAACAGVELAVGDQGELKVRGDIVFAGYYRNEEATRAAIRDGWLHTGDVVEMADGEIRIVDRMKDIIITAGGKNLSPSEIENTVKASPYIKECIVIGEARKYVSALIQLDFEIVSRWAEENRIAFTNFRSLAENATVRELLEREIAAANAQLAQVAHIRRFHVLTKELDHDDDEVTATMKVRRANIATKYTREIEELYA